MIKYLLIGATVLILSACTPDSHPDHTLVGKDPAPLPKQATFTLVDRFYIGQSEAFLLQDRRTGCEYLFVERWSSAGVSVNITPVAGTCR